MQEYKMPTIIYGNELKRKLLNLPEYSKSITNKSPPERLEKLSTLYDIYIPSDISCEIYLRLYFALSRSLSKKNTINSVIQRHQNHLGTLGNGINGIIGGADSFTVIAPSGMGKTSSIKSAVRVISENGIIENEYPYIKIVPFLTVECPFDSSVKGLLLEILRKTDEILGSNFYLTYTKSRASTDMLIGCVSQVALNNIGVLIIDEIQNVVNSKNGRQLIGSLTQLINNSGISICMVGTPECIPFFKQDMKLARRSIGIMFDALNFDDYYQDFCKILLSYCYTRYKPNITDELIRFIYEHSGGVISTTVSLIHDAQEIAILTGSEILNTENLLVAYEKRLSMLKGYIKQKPITKASPKVKSIKLPENNMPSDENLIENTVLKYGKERALRELKNLITIEEVKV